MRWIYDLRIFFSIFTCGKSGLKFCNQNYFATLVLNSIIDVNPITFMLLRYIVDDSDDRVRWCLTQVWLQANILKAYLEPNHTSTMEPFSQKGSILDA